MAKLALRPLLHSGRARGGWRFSEVQIDRSIYLSEREHVHVLTHTSMGGGRSKGRGERETQADSLLSVEPNVGLDLVTLRSQPALKSRVTRLIDCATQTPQGQTVLRPFTEEWEGRERWCFPPSALLAN